MSSFQEFAHLQIPLAEIKSATDNFADEYIIGKGRIGNFYKAQLLRSGELINIAAKRLDHKHWLYTGRELWTQISVLSSLKHKNLVSVVGFCDEDGEKIMVHKYETNGSLDKFLGDPITLTWLQRLHICVGAARALSYIHYDAGRSFDVIHCDIKSSKILLDENWEAKVGGFGLSVATQRNRFVLDTYSTPGYADPVRLVTGTVTHKSDVYSFGVMLFEVLCGKEADSYTEHTLYLSETAKQHYEKGKLDEIILPDLRTQMNQQSFTIFSETAYHCLQEQRAHRPDMEKVARVLEKAWELQRKHENPEHSKNPVTGALSNYLKERNLEHLTIQLDDIKLATHNFSETYCIGSGGYGKVYKAELDHFDNKGDFSKRRGTVAIKRIFNRSDGQGEQSFFSEIEMLTRCNHPNVVSLLGFCDEAPERILVYEYLPNGSLDDYLGNNDKMTIFSWVERIKMCLDIANGLNYLHSIVEEKQMIIHRDMKSANVLLGKNWEAKIADFGLSRIQHANQQGSTLNTYHIAGTEVYLDPEYAETGKLKKESDIYSFGVVLFEILSGKLAYDKSYNVGNDKGLPYTVRRFFNEGILKEIVDPRVVEETNSNNFKLNRGPNQDSLDAFLNIAYQCLSETRAKRPTIKAVIKELKKALSFQKNCKDNLKISLEDIKLATHNFSDDNLIGRGRYGKVYKGEVTHANGCGIIAANRLDIYYLPESKFLSELEILMEYKHENLIGLVGYCEEMGEKIIVYEYASNNSLDLHLNNDNLSWMKRLEICIDVASVLEFFHGGCVAQEVVIHRVINSSNIFLTEDWKAKISDFGFSLVNPINQETDYAYCDPLYKKNGFLTKESEIYSFGMVLLAILCGSWIDILIGDDREILTPLLKRYYEEGKFKEMVFMGIKEQIVPNSLTTFLRTAYQCLNDKREERPTASEVVVQLKKALDIQMDHEMWEPKLPKDYKEIIQMSNSPEIYSAEKKEDLYNVFSNGILLQKGTVVLSFDGHGERNELISATKFIYRTHSPHKWRSLTESRFDEVAEMLDVSNLMIKIETKPQFLSPDVVYGVHLVFKFSESRDFPSKPIYVNLKYKMGDETLHAYFATQRDHEWMMIELYRFLNQKDNVDFMFLIESLSPYCCGDDAIYVEGIEFRALNQVKHEEMDMVKEVHQVFKSNWIWDHVQRILRTENEKLFSLSEVNGKKHLMLSAKAVFNSFSDLKLYKLKPSAESRFQEVIELLPQQILSIHYTIESQLLSCDTEYICYLVFKLSEKSQGMHSPVKVRDLLHRETKEPEIIYFTSPNPWNLHDITRVPKQREDGWTEVYLSRFNVNHELEDACLPVNLKFISYEGTMSGLIVCSLEFRPM